MDVVKNQIKQTKKNLDLSITNSIVSSKVYDFNFDGVYIFQLIRFARV